MLIDIAKITSKPDMSFNDYVDINISKIDFNGNEYEFDKQYKALAHIKNLGNKKIMCKLKADITLITSCDRCLSKVLVPIEIDFEDEITVTPEGGGIGTDDEAGYIGEFMLDTDKLVKSEIYPRIPVKILCSPDCKGICPECGKNLNDGECSCLVESLDPRMARIRDIFNNFKEV